MSDDGLVSVTFSINKKKKLVYPTKVVTRGFMDPSLSANFENYIKQKANDILNTSLAGSKGINIKYIERQMAIQLSQAIYKKTERKPLIVTIVNIIEKQG